MTLEGWAGEKTVVHASARLACLTTVAASLASSRLAPGSRLTDVFVSHQGNPYLVFELLEMDLKQYMDQNRGRPVDVLKAKVSPASCFGVFRSAWVVPVGRVLDLAGGAFLPIPGR